MHSSSPLRVRCSGGVQCDGTGDPSPTGEVQFRPCRSGAHCAPFRLRRTFAAGKSECSGEGVEEAGRRREASSRPLQVRCSGSLVYYCLMPVASSRAGCRPLRGMAINDRRYRRALCPVAYSPCLPCGLGSRQIAGPTGGSDAWCLVPVAWCLTAKFFPELCNKCFAPYIH